MMISPEGYCEEYLKGKDEKQIMRAIRGLKPEIGKLKNIMESPDYGSKAIIKPSERTRLWCIRLYLDRAKQTLADIGGTYTPSARSAGNAVFTGLFQLYCYTYLCIKNLVLIDSGCSSGGMFVQSVDFIK